MYSPRSCVTGRKTASHSESNNRDEVGRAPARKYTKLQVEKQFSRKCLYIYLYMYIYMYMYVLFICAWICILFFWFSIVAMEKNINNSNTRTLKLYRPLNRIAL